MSYVENIERLIRQVSPNLVNFQEARKRNSPPSQVSSEFLTNKEQGDWAEQTLMKGINESSSQFIAVKYGRSDDLIAGEDDFKAFFEYYQKELDEIGKRPDILIFSREDFPYQTADISDFRREILDQLVPKAKCGIEVRSSAFLFDTYETCMNQKQARLLSEIFLLKNTILTDFGTLLKTKDEELFKIIDGLNENNVHVLSFRAPSWRSTEALSDLSDLLKELKSKVAAIHKRTFLSITPKVEDLKVVYTWIKKYNVPHYYVQVFFDKAYGISFEKIIRLIGDPGLEGTAYFIEADVKNQNKTTIKINANKEECILEKICLPDHYSQMKELGRGRLLFYVKFRDSVSALNKAAFQRLFGISL